MSTNINFDKKLGITGGTRITLPTSSTPSFQNLNSFSFDGVDDYFLGTSTYSELDGQSKVTISAWIKVETNTDTTSYLCSIEGGSAFTIGIRLQTTTSTLCWVYVNGAGNNSRAFANIGTIKNDGLWHHFVVCLDLSLPNTQECQIYLDNVAQSMSGYFAGSTLPNANSGLFIGNRNSTFSGQFGGKVDELAIWSGTDLRNDVATIYNNGEPTDLNDNGLTAPTTWQRMGEDATWNGAIWTMTDVNGGYSNRSINMVEANRTTDVPTASTFSNTQSIALDGIDDFVSTGLNLSYTTYPNVSFSCWVKMDKASLNTFTSYSPTGAYVQTFPNSSPIRIYTDGSKNAYVRIQGNGTSNTTTDLADGNWHHIVQTCRYEATGTVCNVYIDGTQEITNQLFLSYAQITGDFFIGARTATTQFFMGGIDEVAVFDSELSQSDVTSIYNGGVPNDISSLNPLSWWRCGDGDTAPTLTDNGSGGNNGTMTNFSTFSTDVPTIPFSTRSIALDGVDDFVTMGNVLNMADDGTDSFSCSFWMKRNSFSTEMIVSKQLNSGSYNGFAIYIVQGRLTFFIGSGTSPDSKISGRSTNYVIGSTWNNVILTYDGSQDISGFNIYINGVSDSVVTLSNNTPTKVSNTTDFRLSGRGGGTALVYGGGLDEVAFWNGTELTSTQANEIGGTIPTDLSTYNPTSWWRCGDNDTAPTLTDNGSASNDGTMTNFTTFSTDVPT